MSLLFCLRVFFYSFLCSIYLLYLSGSLSYILNSVLIKKRHEALCECNTRCYIYTVTKHCVNVTPGVIFTQSRSTV